MVVRIRAVRQGVGEQRWAVAEGDVALDLLPHFGPVRQADARLRRRLEHHAEVPAPAPVVALDRGHPLATSGGERATAPRRQRDERRRTSCSEGGRAVVGRARQLRVDPLGVHAGADREPGQGLPGDGRVDIHRIDLRLDCVEAAHPVGVPLCLEAERDVHADAGPELVRNRLPRGVQVGNQRQVARVAAGAAQRGLQRGRRAATVLELDRGGDEVERAHDLDARDAGEAGGIEEDGARVLGRGRLPGVGVS